MRFLIGPVLILLLAAGAWAEAGPAAADSVAKAQVADSIFARAKAAFQTGNYPHCINLLIEYRDLAGVDYALEYYLGMSFFYLGHYKWAVVHLETARVLNQTHEAAILFVLTQIYASAGQPAVSRERFQELKKKYPQSSYVQNYAESGPSVAMKLKGALGSIYHSDYYVLQTVDAFVPYKEDGWMHEVSGGYTMEWDNGNTFELSLLHDNSLQKGIASYQSAGLGLGIPIGPVKSVTRLDLSASSDQMDKGNLSLTLDLPTMRGWSVNGGWSWLAWPNLDFGYDHFSSLSARRSLWRRGILDLSVDLGLNYMKAREYRSQSKMGIAYVSGVQVGTHNQTAFFADPGYTVQVDAQHKEQIPGNRFLTFDDFPDSLFVPEDASRWLVLGDQVPYSYGQVRLSHSVMLWLGKSLAVVLSPSVMGRVYPTLYQWYQDPIFEQPDYSPVRDEQDYWWITTPLVHKYFVVYINQEDGERYYRTDNGQYHLLDLNQGEMQRIDYGFGLPVSFSWMPAPWLLVSAGYTYTYQTSNLPDEAPVIAGYQDHAVSIRATFLGMRE